MFMEIRIANAGTPARQGFFISAGLAYANATGFTDYNGATNSRAGAQFGYYLGLGGTINAHWRVGFEADGWTNLQHDSTELVQFNNVMVTFYPRLRNGFWIKAGLGYALEDVKYAAGTSTTGGFGGGLGAGYDWSPWKGAIAVIPYVNYMFQFTSGNVSQVPGLSLRSSMLQVGIGVGYKH